MSDKILAVLLILFFSGCDNRQCLKSHTERRRQYAWTQFLYIGKSMIPIFHPAIDYEVEVCDEYEEAA